MKLKHYTFFLDYYVSNILCRFVCINSADKIKRTVKIEASTVEIEERGVKLRLTVVDTPGFADAIDSTEW